MRSAAAIGFALFLVASSARATEPENWSADVTVGNEWMGPSTRPTGGVSISVGARYAHPLGEQWGLVAGPAVEAFGFAGGVDVMGVIVSPKLGGSWRHQSGTAVELTGEMGYAKADLCNDWGICTSNWGWMPGGTIRVSYTHATVSAVLDTTLRYVDAPAYEGAALRIAGGGRIAW